MAKVSFKQSNIYQGFINALKEYKMYGSQAQFEKTTKGLFQGIAAWLGSTKSTTDPVGLTVTDFKGNVLMIAYCQYVPSEEDSDTSGSWLIDFSFNQDDMPEKAKVVDIKDTVIFPIFDKMARNNGYYYMNNSDLIVLAVTIVRTILDWLDTNAKETEEVALDYENLFNTSVGVENGEKFFGIKVSEEVKNIVKGVGDDLLESANVK